MAAIDRTKFAQECLKQGKLFGAYAHYMLAVAQLRSKIDDAKKGTLHGPFQLSQDQWDKQRVDPKLKFQPADIDSWEKQCALFACWAHKVNSALSSANGQDPNAEDLYSFQYPGDPVTGLDQAFSDTKDLMPAPVHAPVATSAMTLTPQQPS